MQTVIHLSAPSYTEVGQYIISVALLSLWESFFLETVGSEKTWRMEVKSLKEHKPSLNRTWGYSGTSKPAHYKNTHWSGQLLSQRNGENWIVSLKEILLICFQPTLMKFWHLSYLHIKESGKQSQCGNIGLQNVFFLDQREDY